MSHFEDLQKLALLAVLKPDYNSWMRRVCRWYSKSFQTPLEEVENLPTTYVLQHYWEAVYEDLEDDERLAKIVELLENPEDRAIRLAQEKADEDLFVAALEEELKANPEALKNKKTLKKGIKAIEKLSLKPPPGPEEVDIRFVDESILDQMVEAADSKGKPQK